MSRAGTRPLGLHVFPFSGSRHARLGEAITTAEALTVLATALATHRFEFAAPDAKGPHDGPEVGVDSVIDRQPGRDAVVRFVPREHVVSPDAAVRLAATARSESGRRRPEPSSVRR